MEISLVWPLELRKTVKMGIVTEMGFDPPTPLRKQLIGRRNPLLISGYPTVIMSYKHSPEFHNIEIVSIPSSLCFGRKSLTSK